MLDAENVVLDEGFTVADATLRQLTDHQLLRLERRLYFRCDELAQPELAVTDNAAFRRELDERRRLRRIGDRVAFEYNRRGPRIGVKNLRKTEDGWFFTVTVDGAPDNYRTNKAGEGLFRDNTHMTQLTGTAQFTLVGCSKSAAYHRIRRWFS